VNGTLPVVALGFLLGVRHATDPDHVVAVATIVSRQRSAVRAAIIGATWGVGHSITLFLVGGAIILFGLAVPPRLGLAAEFAVGTMLVLLGLSNIASRVDAEAPHRGSHDDSPAEHSHAHARPFVVGIVHGLAGSAAVALLVLATIREPVLAAGYLLVFGVGTVAGMVVMTTLIALPLTYSSRRSADVGRAIRVASGVLSVAFGLFIAYRIAIVQGLFTGHPIWTPE